MPEPQDPREARRAQLLDVALTLFGERGYHDVSIANIIGRAGVARGTFYNYFPSKRDIFGQLLDTLFERVAASVAPIAVAAPAEMHAQIRTNLVALGRTLDDNQAMTRMLLEQAVGLDAEATGQLRGFYARILDRIEKAVVAGQRMGLVRAGDPPTLAMCLLGLVKEPVFQRVIGTRQPPIDTLVDEVFAAMSGGFLRSG